MKLLAIDTSARAASAAVTEDGRVLCENYVDVKLTHSETLMPMVQAMLQCAGLRLDQMDGLAVSAGPGSFTGLRIGISAVKGMAYPLGLPCVGVSTLEGLAYNLLGREAVVHAVMDARCRQVYTAAFQIREEQVERLTEDRAVSIQQLGEDILAGEHEKPVILVGDGALLCYNSLKESCPVVLAPPQLRYQRAASVCLAAQGRFHQAVSPGELAPAYLRLPQAERERLKKEGTI